MRDKSIYTATFLNYCGYFVYLMLLFYTGLNTASLGFSVGLRLIVLLALFVFFIKSSKLKVKAPSYIFILFSVFYLSRILIDAAKGLPYFVTTTKLILYYLSFCMIPFLLLCNTRFRITDFVTIRKALLASGFIFSLLALFFFRSYIGTVGRLTTATAETDMLSPLALSYCSSLSIGIAASYWMENKTKLVEKIFLAALIVLSATPFFLGSSRGSLVALVFPFFLIMISKKNIVANLRLIFVSFLALVAIVYFSEYFGSSLIDRLTSTTSDIEQGDASAIRTIMWENALNQFANYPILGDRLKVDGFDIYPHNIFVEILQCTGLLGFIPFFLLTIIVFNKTMKIFRHSPANSWLGVLFIQCFMQNMFSGSISSASWLMVSMAFVLAFTRQENNLLPETSSMNQKLSSIIQSIQRLYMPDRNLHTK